MRSVTEYIKSPDQQVAAKLEGTRQTRQQMAAKSHFRQAEAQGLADVFRSRVEKAMSEEFEDWIVAVYEGDLVRKAFLKVRVSEVDFVHLYFDRSIRGETWSCRYAPWKGAQDVLEQAPEDYESLPERGHCGEKMDLTGCTTMESCAVM